MKIALIAMSGIRTYNPMLLRLGMTLSGFAERGRAVASLPSLSLLTLAASIMALIAVAPCDAQSPAERLRGGLESQTRLMPESTTLNAQETRVLGERSGVLAGVLSAFIFPGVGSYYAGNTGHGTRHLVVGLVTLGGFVGGVAAAEGCVDESRDPNTACSVAVISALAYRVNWVWSIFTGVGACRTTTGGWADRRREAEYVVGRNIEARAFSAEMDTHA